MPPTETRNKRTDMPHLSSDAAGPTQSQVEHGDGHSIIVPAETPCSLRPLVRRPAEVISFATLLAKVRAKERRAATSADEPEAKKAKTQ
jgi:hypothetical protein